MQGFGGVEVSNLRQYLVVGVRLLWSLAQGRANLKNPSAKTVSRPSLHISHPSKLGWPNAHRCSLSCSLLAVALGLVVLVGIGMPKLASLIGIKACIVRMSAN